MTDAIWLSVVIPAHNAAATLGDQLDALGAQRIETPVEILVVDNRSTDATRAIVAERATRDPRVRLVVADEGAGPSYARNAGVAAANGEVIACCDADDVVADGWLATMAGALRSHPYVGGPLEVDVLNPRWLADARGRWGEDRPGRFGDLEFAHGCNLGIHRDTYLGAGGLDEELHAGEEIDLAIRLAMRGVTLTFTPDAVVHYRYRTDLRANARQAFAYGRVSPVLEARATAAIDFRAESNSARRARWLVLNAYRVATRTGRYRWTWIAAYLSGRVTAPKRERYSSNIAS